MSCGSTIANTSTSRTPATRKAGQAIHMIRCESIVACSPRENSLGSGFGCRYHTGCRMVARLQGWCQTSALRRMTQGLVDFSSFAVIVFGHDLVRPRHGKVKSDQTGYHHDGRTGHDQPDMPKPPPGTG